eukprot:Partr_v1_DN27832_c1_g2_i1_m23265 putative g2 mitotic-specific
MFQRKTTAGQSVGLRSQSQHFKSSDENKVSEVKETKSIAAKSASIAATAAGRKRRVLGDVSNQAPAAATSTARDKAKVAKVKPTVSKSIKETTTTIAVTSKRQSLRSASSIPLLTAGVDADLNKRQKTVEQAWTDLDADDHEDPMMVSEYVVEIFEYLRELEIKMLPDPNYMLKQKELRWKMRSILIDWLVEVHHKFKLLPETLFLTINIIDRFLSSRTVMFAKLQLVGVTAMFIAAKFEEVFAPSINQFVYMTDGGYTTEEIIKAERAILSHLDFNLQFPNPLNFLRRVSKADGYDLNTRTMGKYLMEITLLDECFIKYPPSLIAASAMFISRIIYGNNDWSPNMAHYAGYEEDELEQCVIAIVNALRKETTYESVKNKYSSEKHRYVACTVEGWMEGCMEHRSYGMPWI